MNERDHERLRAMLREDLEDDSQAERLLPTVLKLRALSTPSTAPEPLLLATLAAHLPPRRRPLGARLRYAGLLLMAQIPTISRAIWAGSALVFALGALVSLTSSDQRFGSLTTLSAIAPVVAAVGVALLYEPDSLQAFELEDSTPGGMRQILLARLTLVFGFDLVLAMLCSLALALLGSTLSFSELVQSWLAPMTFLCGLAFLLSVLLLDALNAALLSLSLWLFHLVAQMMDARSELWVLLSLPGLSAPENRWAVFGCGLLLMAAALWISGLSDRRYARRIG